MTLQARNVHPSESMNKTTSHEAKRQSVNGTRSAALTGVRHATHRLRQQFDQLKRDQPMIVLAGAAAAGFALGTVFASRIARLSVAFSVGYFTRDLLGESGIAEELKRAALSFVAKPIEAPES